MNITDEVTRKVATKIVNEIFIPSLIPSFTTFIDELRSKIIVEQNYAILSGYHTHIKETPILNLSQSTDKLIEDIVTAFGNHNHE